LEHADPLHNLQPVFLGRDAERGTQVVVLKFQERRPVDFVLPKRASARLAENAVDPHTNVIGRTVDPIKLVVHHIGRRSRLLGQCARS